MVKKHPDIDALNQYILDVRDIPFNWHTNDCFMFTNNAFRAMYGQGWADDWVGKYIKNGKYLKRDELRSEGSRLELNSRQSETIFSPLQKTIQS